MVNGKWLPDFIERLKALTGGFYPTFYGILGQLF